VRVTVLVRSVGERFSATGMVLLRHAEELQRRGHRVVCLVPADRGDSLKRESFVRRPNISYKARKLGNILRGGAVHVRCRWLGPRYPVPILEVPDLSPRHIPDGDAVIAGSAWMLDAVAAYPAAKGRPFYLIQAYELDAAANRRRYALPVRLVAVSSFLRERIERALGIGDIAVVNNGVDLDLFSPGERRPAGPVRRIGMVYYYKASPAIKAVPDGIAALAAVRRGHPCVSVTMFGTRRDRGVPRWVEFHAAPSRGRIAEIYRSCDVFVCPSREEACQLPPMEAMACGCALVATNVGGVPDYAVAGRTALVSPPGRPELLAAGLRRLIGDPRLCTRIAGAGCAHIREFSWPAMAAKLDEVLQGS